jgi:hypothetical protein
MQSFQISVGTAGEMVFLFFKAMYTTDAACTIAGSDVLANWASKINTTHMKVRSITILDAKFFSPTHVGFLLVRVDATDVDGVPLADTLFLRGDSVCITPILVDADSGEEFTVVVSQLRPGAGDIVTESPAGKLDNSNNSIFTIGAKEVMEELDVAVTPKELIDLSAIAWNGKRGYSSVGGQDEAIAFLAFKRTVTKETLASMHSKCTGEAGTNERIQTRVIPLKDLLFINDIKAATAYMLITELRTREMVEL